MFPVAQHVKELYMKQMARRKYSIIEKDPKTHTGHTKEAGRKSQAHALSSPLKRPQTGGAVTGGPA